MTNLGIVVHLVATHASIQLERLQDGMTEGAQVSEKRPRAEGGGYDGSSIAPETAERAIPQ
jgi:hypothetical protein